MALVPKIPIWSPMPVGLLKSTEAVARRSPV